MTDSENKILHWVRCVVEEAFAVGDFTEGIPIDYADPYSLSDAILEIWSHFFKSNTQWPFINTIGEALHIYLDMRRNPE